MTLCRIVHGKETHLQESSGVTEHDWACQLAPGVKTGFIEFKSPHTLWRGTRFGVTFETSIESAAVLDRFVFHTEKPMKPMANLRPFLMLGSAGTMATLRSLGFRGFHPTYASASRVLNPTAASEGQSPC